MSLIKTDSVDLTAYSDKIIQRYYFSNYYTLTNSNVFVEYKNPINLNENENFFLSHYLTNFGDNLGVIKSNSDEIVSHQYNFPGSYFLTYSAVYVNTYGTLSQFATITKSLNTFKKIIASNKNIDPTTPAGIAGDSSYEHANYAILKYKPQLQLQLVEFAKYHYPSAMNNNNALSAKCYRDMGYVIDAVAADILNNANHRSVDLANMYFQTSLASFTGSTVPVLPANEVTATIESIRNLKYYITGQTIPTTPPPFTDVGILSSLNDGSARNNDVIDRIDDIIYALENNGALNPYIPSGNPSQDDITTANFILSKKSRIQLEIKSYVISKGYLSDKTLLAKCNRDVGLMVDAICYELQTGVASRSIEYALTYWDGSSSRIPNSSVGSHILKTVDTVDQIGVSINAILMEKESNINTLTYGSTIPFIVKSSWETYNQLDIRLYDEIILQLPYTLEQINIQPNEWGVADIFNTSIYRLNECLEYLINKTKTINTYTPTIYCGWLGNSSGTSASTLKWHTPTYNSEYLNSPDLSHSSGTSYFSNIIDFHENDKLIYVLDNGSLRFLSKTANPQEIIFSNGDQISSLFVEPVSIAVDPSGYIVYVADKNLNTIFKLKLTDELNINIQLFVGGFGSIKQTNNFNTPTEIIYKNDNLFVLDYNNLCIKQYNEDLNWLYTYNIPEFDEDKPISFDVLENGLIYILTENYKVYIFDNYSNILFESFSIPDTIDQSSLNKIRFSANQDFCYILTENNLYKYTLSGNYISKFVLPKKDSFKYTNVKTSKDQSVFISSSKFISKTQDVLQVFRLGEGLEYNYWSKDQLTINKNEFSSDLNYNRSLIRTVQNVKTFKNNINAKFVIANENIKNNIITYFSYLPIDLLIDAPKLSSDIELENVSVGVNELHLPPVLNKELKKIYNALEILSDFLSIKSYFVKNSDCIDSFCWSWDATSCYNLKLPVIKTCNINPISFSELEIGKYSNLNYAPRGTWDNAISKCCEKITS